MIEELDFLPARVSLNDWCEFRVEDFSGYAGDGIVVALPKPLAGIGTRRQLDGLVSGIVELFGDTHHKIGYVGPPIPDGPPLVSMPLAPVPPSDSAEQTYRSCTSALTAAFEQLARTGCERLVLISMGYTAFGPEAARRAFEATKQLGMRELLILVVDSAFPDRDRPEYDVGTDGYPMSRFYEPAYRCSQDVTVAFLLTSAYPYDARLLADRRPAGCPVGLIAPPYTESYIDELSRSATRGRTNGPAGLAGFLDLASWSPGDVLIPFVSSDIWSPSAVGAWMRPAEYDTVVRGTHMMLSGLAEVAERRNCRVFVPIDAGVTQAVDTSAHGAGLALLPYAQVPQGFHAEMLGAADLAISRTGPQANSSVVLALAATPSIVLDLPAAGYMQAELCSAVVEHDISIGVDGIVHATGRPAPLGWLARWDWTSARFADSVEAILNDPTAARQRAASAELAFRSLAADAHNLFAMLARLVGRGD